ncbi:MAG TPA: phosphate-starvation-inducible PsiE family protein [Chloroflexota bacterium]|nr:phosphate-starvation-inducible PsiE family protein [Chloroflexota bacterium]
MEPAAEPLPAEERPQVDAGGARRGASAHALPASRAARLAAWLASCHRWLRLVQDALLVAIAVVLLLMGVYVLVTGVGDLLGSVTLHADTETGITLHVYQGQAVVEVAENALLALILAELVGTLLLSLGGRPLTVQPFLIIAVVAAVRHLLLETVKNTEAPNVQMVQLLGLGGLILLLVIALALAQWVQGRTPSRSRGGPPA